MDHQSSATGHTPASSPSYSSTSSPSSASSAVAGHLPIAVNSLSLVFHADLLILSFFVLFALLTIPRLITRIFRQPERSLGHMFRSNPQTRPLQRGNSSLTLVPTNPRPVHSKSEPCVSGTNDVALPPPPIRSWSSRFPLISSILSRPAFPGCSIGRLVIFAVYFGIVLYAGVYGINPFSGFKREGFVAMSQLPIIFALGTKNNILGMLLSVGYEKVSYLNLI